MRALPAPCHHLPALLVDIRGPVAHEPPLCVYRATSEKIPRVQLGVMGCRAPPSASASRSFSTAARRADTLNMRSLAFPTAPRIAYWSGSGRRSFWTASLAPNVEEPGM